jgi:hypothetical protein
MGAETRPDVGALALVGSHARGPARSDSDVDLVLLTEMPALYTEQIDWAEELAPGAMVVHTGDWGAIVERRLRLPDGLEIEVGIGRASWAATEPLDQGTYHVVRGGFRALHDPQGLLAALGAATAGQAEA